jgi:hypothetical protein
VSVLSLIATAAIAVAVAAYAQSRIARFTASVAAARYTRIVLAAVGIAFGAVAVLSYPQDGLRAALIFLCGFGAVHFPAAVILLVKRGRGSGKT